MSSLDIYETQFGTLKYQSPCRSTAYSTAQLASSSKPPLNRKALASLHRKVHICGMISATH